MSACVRCGSVRFAVCPCADLPQADKLEAGKVSQTFPKGTRARAAADREARTIGWRVVRIDAKKKSKPSRLSWLGTFDAREGRDGWEYNVKNARMFAHHAHGRQFALMELHRVRVTTIGDDGLTYKLVRVMRRDVRAEERARAAGLLRKWYKGLAECAMLPIVAADFVALIAQIESDAP